MPDLNYKKGAEQSAPFLFLFCNTFTSLGESK
jgi:hypothetical protein